MTKFAYSQTKGVKEIFFDVLNENNEKMLLREFLVEIDYDFSYFLNLCKKANSLEKIVNSKIDFRSMIRNHIGIINGKYEQQSKGITKETIQAAMQAYKLKKGLKGG